MQVGEAKDEHEECCKEELQPHQTALQRQRLNSKLVEEEHPHRGEAVARACHEDLKLLRVEGRHCSKGVLQ